MSKVSTLRFYAEWAGHPLSDLHNALQLIKAARPDRPIIWLAGDSSLDNKAWILSLVTNLYGETYMLTLLPVRFAKRLQEIPSAGPGGEPLLVEIPDIYRAFLDPPRPKPDVAFWLNHFLGPRATAVDAAIEATLLRQRDDSLLPHDQCIRDNITTGDVLVVSVGANDIALSPTTSTIRHMAQLAWLTTRSSIDNGTASSLKHFRKMFKDETGAYISRLVSKEKPRAVLLCMIYFPLQADAGAQPGWAESQLKMLGYNRDPGQLQAAIRKMYEQATVNAKVEGTKVVPVMLHEAMDGKTARDYVARVEPSVEGGRKMARQLFDKLKDSLT